VHPFSRDFLGTEFGEKEDKAMNGSLAGNSGTDGRTLFQLLI